MCFMNDYAAGEIRPKTSHGLFRFRSAERKNQGPAPSCIRIYCSIFAVSLFMKKLKEENFDDYWKTLTQGQKDDFMLLTMAESALIELSAGLKRHPHEQEIYDYLFKGGRSYKDIRQKERRLRELFALLKTDEGEKFLML
jgi:hypothetical protein